MVTADTPVAGRRLRDEHNQLTMPPEPTARTVVQSALHPAWALDLVSHDAPALANFERTESTVHKLVGSMSDPDLALEHLEWLREEWPGKFVVKGILAPDDARRVADFGGQAGAVLAYPLFWSLASGSMPLATLAKCLAGLLAMGATSPGTSTFVANLCPTRYRFTGVAGARELNGALVAGPTPLITTALIQKPHGGIGPVSALVALAALCTFVSIFVAGHSGQEAPSEDVEANRTVESETRS